MSFDDYEDDLYDRRPIAVDLNFADKGFRLCPECLGQGTHMFHKCYDGNPVECEEYCDTCNGEGQVEIELVASISRNKREGLYVGVKSGLHTRAKVLSAKHGISLMFVKRPMYATALVVRNYREGVWK